MNITRRAARAVGNVTLWLLALVGVLCGALWAANAAGLVQPFIVVSGSMEPGIMTGDLLVATPVAATDAQVGDVVTLRSELTGENVSHRITSITAQGEEIVVRLKGDANDQEDPQAYVVSADDDVWRATWVVPGAGRIATTLMRPQVLIPGIAGVLALSLLALFPARRDDEVATRHREDVTTERAEQLERLP